eukprot:gene12817-14799_t
MSVQQAMLCGDEIKSAIIDLGSSTCRFGTAGQDMPRHVFRSDIGSISDGEKTRSLYGDGGLRYLHKDMHVRSLSHHSVAKWDDIEQILTYGVEQCMRLDTKDTPLFLADNALISGGCPNNSTGKKCKEQIMETCFEKVGTPGLYFGNGAILSAFSAGRVNSLVVDIGAAGTKITPIVEGYQLQKSSIYTSRGGNLLDEMLLSDILNRTGKPIRPWFECSKKGAAGNSSTINCGYGVTSVTPTFRNIHVRDVVRDVKQWMCFVPHNPISTTGIHDPVVLHKYREDELIKRGLQFPPPYELPDGTLVSSGDTICTAPEAMFFTGNNTKGTSGNSASNLRKRTRDLIESTFAENANSTSSASSSGQGSTLGNALNSGEAMDVIDSTTSSSSEAHGYPPGSLMQKLGPLVDTASLTDLIYACIAHVDVDVRKELLSNIQIVGGGSLIQGLSNRLAVELNGVVPSHMKVKLVNALPIERQHAAWVGGSILGICGSFQQLWLTKSEYEELGPQRAALRFDH